ncbi:MAG: TolC family protein, partial [Lachnospiraceae bacterium]|nr:TolC family protein [Lachnospiraceae bacterium]
QDAVSSKQAAYESAVKSLKLKKKNMSTFRWSPLLSFKFPQKMNFAEESEQTVKPMSIQNEIRVAEHKVQDKVFAINEEINNLYVDIVTFQERLSFNEKRLSEYEDNLQRTQSRMKIGQATKSDIDRIQKKVDKLKNTISNDRRNYESSVQKLSKKIGLDVTTGYEFESPYVEAVIDRDSLDSIITYTEDRDEAYYEACIASTTARMELSTNYDIMKSKYGGDINIISSYVNQALNGQEVSSKAFKSSYKSFLDKIDSYWRGSFRIIFIKISREWLKGDLDGARYIEDDPYTLYNNVLDYVSARNDEASAKEELDQSVKDSFNNYISVRSSYENYKKEAADQQKMLDQYAIQNRMGYMTLDEYQDAVDAYEETQDSMLDAMKLYTTTLYSFDRQTCGAISSLLKGTDADLKTAVTGESFVKTEKSTDAMYFIKSIIQKEMFELSLYIPEDFPVSITDFELWCDNEQIGERTPVTGNIRHLKLAKDNVKEIKIRLYDGDTFVDDCKINSDDESGTLSITTTMDIMKDATGEVGGYTTESNEVTGFTTISFKFLESEGISYYRILTEEGTPLKTADYTPADKGFSYLALMDSDLQNLKIECCGADKSVLYTCVFDTANQKIKKENE